MNINKTIQILSKNTSCKDFGIIINLVNNIIKYIGTNKIIGIYIDKSINTYIKKWISQQTKQSGSLQFDA